MQRAPPAHPQVLRATTCAQLVQVTPEPWQRPANVRQNDLSQADETAKVNEDNGIQYLE
jgi:hypothetical protein